jgi:hypothetical protein
MFFTSVYTNFIYVGNVVRAEVRTTRYWQCGGWSPSAHA